ncbi:rod shape-determining protein MreC [Hamadaea sp. NPDC051192]|uniref:rod shape-determining protein MreC n=1 Tax=Hamadaea sp. NPDC051192 TaxID=3154940 RepID=UPI003420BFD6
MKIDDVEDVRLRLAQLAESQSPSDGEPVRQVRRRAARLQRRRAAAVLSALGVLVAVLGLRQLLIGGGPMPVTAPDGPFLGWAVAGHTTQPDLVERAVRVWISATSPQRTAPVAATDVHVLLADDDTALGAVFVMEARINDEPRLAIVTSSTDDPNTLVLRADRPAPDPTSRVVSFVSARMGTRGGLGSVAWAIAVAAPGVTRIAVTSTTVDDVYDDGGGEARRYVITLLPVSATPLTTTVTAYHGRDKVTHERIQGGAPGDAVAVPAAVLQVSDDLISIDVTGIPAAQPGQLIATPDGLVGRIESIHDRIASVLRATAAGFAMTARTSLSNYTGSLHGTNAGIVFSEVDADAPVLAGNRIEVDDPSQQAPAVGAITVGRISHQTGTGEARSFKVTPSATVGQEVFVLIPGAITDS